MFSAWFGGFGTGLFSMSLAFLAFDYYYVTPIHTFSIDVKEVPRILVFTLATLFAGLLSAAQRRTTESLRRSRDDLEGMVQQLKRSNEALHAQNAERIRAAEAFQTAQEHLARAARLTTIGEFAGSIAHEVNPTSRRADSQCRPPGGRHHQDDPRLGRNSTPEMARFSVNSMI